MNKKILTFEANEQNLVNTTPQGFATDTVSYIEAVFNLGENWSGYDYIKAVWTNGFKTIATILNDGRCIVPPEVLTRRGDVNVNLVGANVYNDQVVERITTVPVLALRECRKALVDGNETQPITPSQFEQFVAVVISEVEKVTGMTATAHELPEDAQPTAEYSNGVLSLGIPKGATGNGIESVSFNDYKLTLTFTDGTSFTTPSIRGEKGDRGDQGIQGETGETPNLSIGNVSTLQPTQPATVAIRGTKENPVMDFGIPQGVQGIQGIQGEQGETGATPNIQIGTVQTLAPTDDATASMSGTLENPLLNLGIPKGDTGEISEAELIDFGHTLAPIITDTAQGSIASFSDGADDYPMKSLVASIEPLQSGSGDPSPDNVRPISGWSGVEVFVRGINMWDEEWEVGALINSGTVDGTLTTRRTTSYIRVFPNTAYYFPMACLNGRYAYYDINKNLLSYNGNGFITYVNTVPSNAYYLRVTLNSNYGTTYNNDISINYPSTDTSYHPYQGSSYSIPFKDSQDNPITVYGGEIDVVSGEGEENQKAEALDGSESWSMPATSYFALARPNLVNDNSKATIICDLFKGDSWARISGLSLDNVVGVVNGQTIRFHFSQITTVADWKNWLAEHNVKIVYELATPTSIYCDPTEIKTLLGSNNVWADTGDTEVEYCCDTKLYIDKKINEV